MTIDKIIIHSHHDAELSSLTEVFEGEDTNNPIIPVQSYIIKMADHDFNGFLSIFYDAKLIKTSTISNGISEKLDIDHDKLKHGSGYEIIITKSN